MAVSEIKYEKHDQTPGLEFGSFQFCGSELFLKIDE
jgi:hypothetical protein